jgi:hypothetical protein
VAERCTELSNGDLCIRTEGCNTVRVAYTKRRGDPIRTRFGFTHRGEERWDEGTFEQRRGQAKAYTWVGQRLEGQVIGFIQVEGQGRFEIPSVPCR